MNTYGQNREDEIISQYFTDPGTLLSIGENDGQTLSNALAFIEIGWSAYLIEPSPTVFPKLTARHKDNIHVQCFQVAISDIAKELTFYESSSASKGEDRALVSSLLPSEILKWKRAGVVFKPIKVQSITWNAFVALHDIDRLDYITIDAEGFDLKILRQINFDQHQTKVVCVEWNSINKHSYVSVMNKYGFNMAHQNAENLIFVR